VLALFTRIERKFFLYKEMSRMSDDIHTIIAKAIKRADRTFFNENYTKQAESVIRAINNAGWGIVPLEPDPEMLKSGKETIEIGRHKPSEVAKAVYTAMVRIGRL
jgi:TRAP-type C4-dicarboxylate transport system substrate-binding protein